MAPSGINKSKDELLAMLRAFLGDTAEENKLIPDEELSNDKLKLALELALDEYNNTPPFEARTFETFPSLAIIIHGAAIQALIMAGLVQSRNFLNFSDGGVQEVISDKAQAYQSWIGNLVTAYRDEALSVKTALNMEQNFSVIPSPYGNVFGV
jgi:hypothetical protein